MHGGYLLWLGGVAGAFMTALYTVSVLYFLVFLWQENAAMGMRSWAGICKDR